MKHFATALLVAGLAASPMLAFPLSATAAVSIGISVNIAPPPLPVYEQPVVPGPGYIWTPGYWDWDASYGYYWVPGTWVMPPSVGMLWTPGWWGWSDGSYRWNAGYWGPRVGFYGGINYGYGYFGAGYVGGQWRGREFYYNRAVNNIDAARIHNVYVNKTVVGNAHARRVSYNGGRGGITAQPTVAQRSIRNEHRVPATSMQKRQREAAMQNPAQRFKANRGRPAVFATQHPGDFKGPHAVRSSSASRAGITTSGGRTHGTVAAPRNRATPASNSERSATQAPRSRPQAAPNREHDVVTAPRSHTQATPNRQHGAVTAPRNRTQVTTPRPQTEMNNTRGYAPPNQRQRTGSNPHATRNQAPRGASSAPRSSSRDQHGKAPPPKKHKQDNDGGHR